MTGPLDGSFAGFLGDLRLLADRLGPALNPRDGQDVLTAVVRTAQAIFGAQACSLALLTDDESELVFTTVSGQGAELLTALRIPAGTGIAGWVVMSGQSVSISDPQRDPRFARNVAASTNYVPSSILASPVATARQTLGVMEVLDRDERRPAAEHDLELLALFAAQAALAVEAIKLFRHFGSALLRAAADAGSGPLADALLAAAHTEPGETGDRLMLAAVVADLGALGEPERRLAVRVLAEITEYLKGRGKWLD